MFSGWLDIPGYTFYQVNLEQRSMRLKSGFTSVLESIETREYDGNIYYGLIKGFEREIIKRWYSIESIKRMIIEGYIKDNKMSFKRAVIATNSDGVIENIYPTILRCATELKTTSMSIIAHIKEGIPINGLYLQKLK